MKPKGLIFDKDGTLFDFVATWAACTGGLIDELAQGDADLAGGLAAALGFDRRALRFDPGSIVIAGTTEDVALAIRSVMDGYSVEDLVELMRDLSAEAPQVQVTPLEPLLRGLAGSHLLGLVTNDAEKPARVHLAGARVLPFFSFIAGFDSGWGGKPEPGQLFAFCAATGLEPGECVMIGDSTHDLFAARAAGMRALGVLTGPAAAGVLRPHAEAVLPDISHLPGWLAVQG